MKETRKFRNGIHSAYICERKVLLKLAKMRIALIVAEAKNRVLGVGATELPWHLPADIKYFKDTTLGHPMIMGRKTFEAFPKPLPGRLHIVISRSSRDYNHERVVVVDSLDAAIAKAKDTGNEKVYVIGGGEIFAQSIGMADELYITEVDGEPEGDVFFPEWNKAEFDEVSRVWHEKDEKHAYSFSFVFYARKK